MTKPSPKPPSPVVFVLALIAVVGVVLLFMGGGALIAGLIMLVVGIFGIVMHKALAKPEKHVELHTAGSAGRKSRSR